MVPKGSLSSEESHERSGEGGGGEGRAAHTSPGSTSSDFTAGAFSTLVHD